VPGKDRILCRSLVQSFELRFFFYLYPGAYLLYIF
jgi:hypothetical protein